MPLLKFQPSYNTEITGTRTAVYLVQENSWLLTRGRAETVAFMSP